MKSYLVIVGLPNGFPYKGRFRVNAQTPEEAANIAITTYRLEIGPALSQNARLKTIVTEQEYQEQNRCTMIQNPWASRETSW